MRKNASDQLFELPDAAVLLAVLENTPGSFLLLEAIRDDEGIIRDFKYVYANSEAVKTSGKTELVGKNLLEEFPFLKGEGVFERYVKVVETGERWSSEVYFRGFDSWAQLTAQKYGDGCVVTYYNISAKKENERLTVERATDKYKTLFNSIDEGFAIVEVLFSDEGMALDFLFLEVNAVFEKQTGLFDPVGKTMKQLVPGHEEHWFHIYGEVVHTQEPRRFEERAEAMKRWYDVYAFPIGQRVDNQVAILFNDITERKGVSRELESSEARRTAELKESRDFIRHVIHSSPNAVLVSHLGASNKTDYLNDQLIHWLGYTRPEYERLGFMDKAPNHPDDRRSIAAFIEGMKTASDSEVRSFEFRMQDKEGRWHTMLSFNRVLTRDANGLPSQVLSNIIDITSEKEAEKKIAEQAHFIEKVISTNPDMVSVVEIPSRKLIYFSHQPRSIAGLTQQEISGAESEESPDSLVFPDDREKVNEYYRRLRSLKDEETSEAEYRLQKKNGEIRWYRVLGKTFRRDQSGQVTHVLNIGHDITAQKKAEHDLREQSKFVNSITNIIPDVVTVVDVETKKVIYFNADPFAVSGYQAAELASMQPFDLLRTLVHPEDLSSLAGYYMRLENMNADEVAEVECRFRKKDGTVFWARVRGRVLTRDKDGKPRQLINIGQNITAEKESRSKIDKALEQFRTLVNNTHDFITRWNKNMEMIFANRAYEESIVGKEQVKDPKRATELSLPWISKIRRVFESGKPADHHRTTTVNNEELHFHAHLVPEFSDGAVTSVLVIERDITVVKRAEKELMDLKLTQQKEILNAIIVAQEQERERIGEALHNGVAQLLYGLQSRLQVLKTASEKDEVHREAALSVVDLAIADTRKVSFELVPTVLRDYGIVVALQSLSGRIVGEHLKFNIVSKGRERRIHEKAEYAVYRIAQELINNVIKHSGATEVALHIGWGIKWLTMSVEDNGHGFDIKDITDKGIGIQSVRNRIRLLDGEISIVSNSAGTKVKIRVPVQDLS